jgi:hypothetical protein
MTGDGTIIARIVSAQNVFTNTKIGVMMRDGATPTSPQAITANAIGAIYFQYRSSTGGSTSSYLGPSVSLPYWVKLVRQGSTFKSYSSSDGVNWSQVGSTVTISSMGSTIYVGLAVSSVHSTDVTTVVFDNVSIQ